MVKLFVLIITVSFLTACKNHTVDNSMFKTDILSLDKAAKAIDSSYAVYDSIDKENLHIIVQEAKRKYSLARSQYKSDTLIIPYDYILAVFKSTFVKGMKSIKQDETFIEKEYMYSKNQYDALKENLIYESFELDSGKYFTAIEKNAMTELLLKTNSYNSKAFKTLAQYDSLTHRLDSIVNIHGKKD